jgi:hypothetical protein
MVKAMRGALLGAMLALTCSSAAHAQPYTIEKLLEDGWVIAGYTGTFDNRSSLLLFRHAGQNYLVQCSTLHDVTRVPRLVTNCYELR